MGPTADMIGTQAILGGVYSQSELVLTAYSPWTSTTVAASTQGGPIIPVLVYADSNGYLYFYVGENQHLYQIFNPGSQYQLTVDLTYGSGSLVSTAKWNGAGSRISGFFDVACALG
jgi:hypothetical protein